MGNDTVQLNAYWKLNLGRSTRILKPNNNCIDYSLSIVLGNNKVRYVFKRKLWIEKRVGLWKKEVPRLDECFFRIKKSNKVLRLRKVEWAQWCWLTNLRKNLVNSNHFYDESRSRFAEQKKSLVS